VSPRAEGRPWTKAEDAFLLAAIAKGMAHEEIGLALRRSRSAVGHRWKWFQQQEAGAHHEQAVDVRVYRAPGY